MATHYRLVACCLVGATLAGLAGAHISDSTGVQVDTSSLEDLRLCSPYYFFSLPVKNLTRSPVEVRRVRLGCPSCRHHARVDRHCLTPDESGHLEVWGKKRGAGPLSVTAFLETDHPSFPVHKVDIRLECGDAYAVELGWQADEERITYPYQSGYRLKPMPLSEEAPLVVKVTPIGDTKVHCISTRSKIWCEANVEIAEGSRELEFVLSPFRVEPGVHYDHLRIIVNETDLVVVPIQIVRYEGFRILNPFVCFGHAQEGSVPVREIHLTFPHGSQIPQDFSLELSPDVARAFEVVAIQPRGTSVSVSVKIDTKFLGGPGLKTIPITILSADGHRGFLTLYGRVY